MPRAVFGWHGSAKKKRTTSHWETAACHQAFLCSWIALKSNRLHPWEHDRALYKKRNEIERLFRKLKGFRRIFSRFEKLDVLFLAFLCFALIVEALRLV